MDRIAGLDVGTMFMCSARKIVKSEDPDKKAEIKTIRNMYLDVKPEMIESAEIAETDLDYVEIRDEETNELDSICIIGEDAYRFSNIFGQKAKRPMQKGVISTEDIDAIDVLTLMIEKLIGKAKDGLCYYSVPAQAVDVDIPPVLYHEKVFGTILKSLGYTAKPLNEAMAIIYSECQKTNFSGIAISFGAGLTNIACAYKGTPTLTFSVSRGGDWIDASAAQSTGVIQTRVTSLKEKKLDLSSTKHTTKSKKERRVVDALRYYYNDIIEYVLQVIHDQFQESAEGLEIDETIPIIVSGGTSKPTGFVDLFKEVFGGQKDFPYDISEIRHAKDPLTAVAYGSLIYALWEEKKGKGK